MNALNFFFSANVVLLLSTIWVSDKKLENEAKLIELHDDYDDY